MKKNTRTQINNDTSHNAKVSITKHSNSNLLRKWHSTDQPKEYSQQHPPHPYQNWEPGTQGAQIDSLLTLKINVAVFEPSQEVLIRQVIHEHLELSGLTKDQWLIRAPHTRCPESPKETTKHLKSGYTPGIRIQTRRTEPPMTPLFSTTEQQLFADRVCCPFWKKAQSEGRKHKSRNLNENPLPSENN